MTYQVILLTDLTGQFYHNKPLGAYSLASTLRANGYSVLVIDYYSRFLSNPKLFGKILKEAIGSNTLLVGFSSTFFTTQLPDEKSMSSWADFNNSVGTHVPSLAKTRLLLKYIQQLNPNTKFVYGGTKSMTLAEPIFDYVVDGYGEIPMLALCENLMSAKPIDTFTRNELTVLDYTTVGEGYFFKEHSTVYQQCDVLLPNETVALETSRGCMFNCSFCDFPLRGRKRDNFDYHCDPKLLKEYFIRNYQLAGITNYMITDDTFNETTEKLTVFRDVVKSTGLPLKFMCFARIDLLHKNPEQLDLLLDAGVISIWVGLESLNQKSSSAISKSYSAETAKQTLYNIRKRAGPDFKIYASFIFGLPEDTPESIHSWMQWVINDSPIDCIQVEPLNIGESTTPWPADFALSPETYGYTNTVKWHNKIWSYDEAAELADEYQRLLWDSGRNKLAAFHLFGMLSYGFAFDEVKDVPLKNLPFDLIKEKGVTQFKNYANKMLNFLLGTSNSI